MGSTTLSLLVLFALFLSESSGDPISLNKKNRIQTLGNGVFSSFGDVASFLRTWFSKIQGRVSTFLDKAATNTSDHEEPRSLNKRAIDLPPNFEEIEKAYLFKLSNEYLEQLFDYAKFIHKDDSTRDDIDRVLQEEVARLRSMTLEELKVYCAKLQQAMSKGINLNHEITVNGNTYSLESIAQVCCPWG